MKRASFDSELPHQSSFSGSRFSPAKRMATYLSLLLLGAGMGVGGVYIAVGSPMLTRTLGTSALAQNNENSQEDSTPAIAAPTNFVSEVVNRVGPAVVRIDASRTVRTQVPEMFDDPFFRRFFGDAIPSSPERQIQRGIGSGFIVSANGQILTNAHVVDGADRVTVTLKDGRTLTGKVLGTDDLTDVAVVKVEAENLPTVKLGDSNALQVGEWAIAIGNPLGLDNTVTTGIISGTGRNSSQIGVGDKRVNFIQTDAAINPGNSGGPLLNAKGEVVGINTAIIRGAQGLGFAIPIDRATQIAEQLIAKGKVEHAYLGIQMAEITPELKQTLQENEGLTINADQGVLIVRVVRNSPAARAGLRAGDVIQTINGQSVSTPSQVQDTVEKTAVGNELSIAVERDGRTVNLNARVGVFPTRQAQG
ncbi:serine protease [Hydrococcus rivularis NIES-593]|uniref:Serine protease n=1 Tax=Hydrococcus rivularis NIES-593 TaxID=1921803 RepID=A0A1U7HF55_9CYAN|nr:HhoA/HhoB/HtrA family serine endopeptidase [Hydrococcus rivularis]OKH22210.1 serine protease [Hydrococcus rivularis NIES-593]